ncbi:MAG: hypothetical protein ACOY94_27405 [Bacillota bacterium]
MELPRALLRPEAGLLSAPRLEVMRLLGYKEGRTQVDERHLALVDRGIALARAAAAPVASLAYCAVTVQGEQVSTAVPGLTWRSRSLSRLLEGAVAVSLVAGTLGPGIEEQTRALFAAEEFALATIVDAAGSALVHGLLLHVQAHLKARAGSLTPLYGPGYGDWPLADQIALTEAAGGPAIGLISTETCYLTPQKSLVGIFGWLAQPGRPAPSGCSLCTMAGCAYRVRPERGGNE